MKYIELVISVVILCLCVTTIGFTYSSLSHNGKKSVTEIYKEKEHIQYDIKIRKIIRNVSFNYLENGKEQIEEAEEKIKKLNIEILGMDSIKDSNGFVSGMEVNWKKSDSSQSFITKEVFLSKVLQNENN